MAIKQVKDKKALTFVNRATIPYGDTFILASILGVFALAFNRAVSKAPLSISNA
jgi:hypothetical protein